MKKSLVALAALAATGVFAQSSVTLSGQMDVGLTNPIGAQKLRVDQSANGANQIVFAGSEDLGGGLRATFRIAQRFSPESGLMDGSAGNRPMMQGETTVGLAGGFGTVRIGRALTALQGPVHNSDPWGTLQQGSVSGGTTTGYSTAADNVAGSGAGLGRTDGIFYTSPNMSGLTVSLTYGPKNTQVTGATATGLKDLTSVWAQYTTGPLTAAVGTEQNRAGDRLTVVQGVYMMGTVRLAASHATLDPFTGADRKGYNVGVTAPFGAFTVKAGIGRSKVDGLAADLKKTGLGVDYALSKRTLVYTSYGRDAAASAAASKSGFDIGVRHTF